MKKFVVIAALIIGVLLAFQIKSYRKVESLIQRSSNGGVLAELRTFQLANEQLKIRLKEEQNALADINSKLAKETVDDEIDQLKKLSGEQNVYGEGVEVTITSPVPEFWISDLVAQLVNAGAEAVAVNDIRLTLRTAGFRSVGNGLVMGKDFFLPPFKISVIGPQKDLKLSLTQAGGIIDKVESAYPGLKVLISTKDKVMIPALP